MPRGGYQPPRKPAAVSGPGRFSRRTDGKITEPDIDKERGLQYGDRKASIDAQRIAQTAVGAGARVASPAARRLTGAPSARGGIPPWLLGTPDTNPSQPTTAGLDMGPGPGSEILDAQQPTDDVRQVVLRFLADTYGNKDAIGLLSQIRTEQGAAQTEPQRPAAMEPVTGTGLPAEELE
jgi:hypothetical protein